jgi:hypothetical protein
MIVQRILWTSIPTWITRFRYQRKLKRSQLRFYIVITTANQYWQEVKWVDWRLHLVKERRENRWSSISISSFCSQEWYFRFCITCLYISITYLHLEPQVSLHKVHFRGFSEKNLVRAAEFPKRKATRSNLGTTKKASKSLKQVNRIALIAKRLRSI